MNRFHRSIIMLLSFILLLGASQSAQARPNAIQCGPYVQPGICSPALHLGDSVVIRQGVPFIWLREVPSSNGTVVNTVFAWSNASLRVIGRDGHWDGYQSWYVVALVSDPLRGGWVEQASLKNALDPIIPTVPPATPNPSGKPLWQVPMTASLNQSVPFAWLRTSPSSSAPTGLTIYPGATFTVLGIPNPVYDGVQWWWYVEARIMRGTIYGWLEQSSIRPLATQPTATAPNVPVTTTTTAAFQTFESGYMIWTAFDQQIYVFNGKNCGTFGGYPISSYETLPDNPVTEPAPDGLVKPIRGFGRVWGNFTWIRQGLGWATQSEQGYTATVVKNGLSMQITLPDGRTIHILRSTWNF